MSVIKPFLRSRQNIYTRLTCGKTSEVFDVVVVWACSTRNWALMRNVTPVWYGKVARADWKLAVESQCSIESKWFITLPEAGCFILFLRLVVIFAIKADGTICDIRLCSLKARFDSVDRWDCLCSLNWHKIWVSNQVDQYAKELRRTNPIWTTFKNKD